MKYSDDRITRKEFIQNRSKKQTRASLTTTLNLFDHFSKGEHNYQSGDDLILELVDLIEKDGKIDRLFRMMVDFARWLGVEHPECIVQYRNYSTHLKAKSPSSIRLYTAWLRAYIEEFGQLDIPQRRYSQMVLKKLPDVLEPVKSRLTKDEIKQFVDVSTFKRKALYMTLKDSGMRIGEAVQLQKEDIHLETTPVSIDIREDYTKTKKGRVTYVTRETRPYLEKLLGKTKAGALVWGSSGNVLNAVNNEIRIFNRARSLLGLEGKYSSGSKMKTLHAFRSYCATQLAEKYSEEFGHGFIGHKKYLGQYIRYDDTLAKKYLDAENYLMVYEKIEIVDEEEYIKKAKDEMRDEMQNEFKKDRAELLKLLRESKDLDAIIKKLSE